MTSLLTNNAAMTALTTLKSINTQLDATSNRVSTGQRVSSAADNAAYWSIATTVRTDNASLSAVKDSLGLGSSSVDTAYNGLNSVLSDLQNMRAKLQTALQPGVDRSKVQTEIAAIQNKMKATADSSNSSGQNWLSVNSSSANTSFQGTQSVVAGFARDPQGTITFSKVAIDVNSIKLYDVNATNITTDATEAKVVGSTALTGTSAFTNGTVDFVGTSGTPPKPKQINLSLVLGDGTSATIKLDKTTLASTAKDLTKVTSDEMLSAINNQISASALKDKVSAGLDTSGRLTFQTASTGAASRLTVQNVAAPLSTSDLTSANAVADNLSSFTGTGNIALTINSTVYNVANTAITPTGTGDRAKLLSAINTAIAASGTTAAYDSTNKLVFTKTDGGALTVSAASTGTAPTLGTFTAPPAYTLADIGFGTATGTAATAAKVTADNNFAAVDLSGSPKVQAGANYSAIDLSNTNTFTFDVNDGAGADPITLNNADFVGLTAPTGTAGAVSVDDFVSLVNAKLATVSTAIASNVGGKLVFQSTGGSVAINGLAPALASMGFSTAVSASATAGTKTFTINDGTGDKTISLGAADYAALTTKSSGASGSRAVNGADMAALINQKLQAAGVNATVDYGTTTASRLTFSSTAAGTSATVTLGGTDLASLGLTASKSATGQAATQAFNGFGTNSGTTTGQGILDSSVGAYSTAGAGSYSIANVDISKLVGTSGDTDLSAIITAVDKAIAKVTDAGTKLGAGKTQIDGQKSFVDTLMKANDRTIGILVDADIEEESTKLKALQTQQQLAVQALSIANGASQNVLSLFR
ncbi:flagellin N-terminal helical domain-containing protein [Methylobacterium flocculans]|uniref:flagellin N-terminal helical domain-containing protein n=1 Tax=Methylobacterium flocculans TaxID=2984843 RepID=UPI0021F395A6|nr:flagellin [Methylobacterium sp. FF17]